MESLAGIGNGPPGAGGSTRTALRAKRKPMRRSRADRPTTHSVSKNPLRLDDLRAEAQHARQRYDLYKARAYGPRPTSVARMREFERACEAAECSSGVER